MFVGYQGRVYMMTVHEPAGGINILGKYIMAGRGVTMDI